MTKRSFDKLHELDKKALNVFHDFLSSLDIKLGDDRYIVFEGRRSEAVQRAYYAQGRKILEEVNELRRAADLFPLRTEKDNYIITYTMKSKHIEGKAMDVIPLDGAGNLTWDLGHFRSFFETIAACGREAGLECGADWPAPYTDWPHYQIKE